MIRRLAIVCTASAVIFAASLGGLWWRLGAGPINLDIASQWLAAALEDNIGHGDTVEVGGTQIERAGRFRIALRSRDIIVRDRDHAIIARVPKAAVRLSGSALLRGRLRAESLTLLDAEISVRIAPNGYVTLSAGDNVRPLPDTFPRHTSPDASSPSAAQSGVNFSRLRAEFIWRNGQLAIRDGILTGPRGGGTIEGAIDYPGNQVRIRGAFVPFDGLNNRVDQEPVLGLSLGGGRNEGLFGVTYEVVGTLDQPLLRVNPLSAIAPGLLRKIFEVNKNPNDFLLKK
jgi:hypothetical protein